MKVQEWCDQFVTSRKAAENGYDHKDISMAARLLKAADAVVEATSVVAGVELKEQVYLLEGACKAYEVAKREEGLVQVLGGGE